MRVNTVRRLIIGPGPWMWTKTFHCESCHQFMYSEDDDIRELAAP